MKNARRKEKVWVPTVVEHDGDELALVSIEIRINGSKVPSKFWKHQSAISVTSISFCIPLRARTFMYSTMDV